MTFCCIETCEFKKYVFHGWHFEFRSTGRHRILRQICRPCPKEWTLSVSGTNRTRRLTNGTPITRRHCGRTCWTMFAISVRCTGSTTSSGRIGAREKSQLRGFGQWRSQQGCGYLVTGFGKLFSLDPFPFSPNRRKQIDLRF